MLSEYLEKYENVLNTDQELYRRFKGFKTFSGLPDGHYLRARKQGIDCVARAVRCYPFGGISQLNKRELIGLYIPDNKDNDSIVISRSENKFFVRLTHCEAPYLTITIPKEIFKKTVMGRHRWIWTLSMNEVSVATSETLPHSDWITLFEILVIMQEMVEFDIDLLHKMENW